MRFDAGWKLALRSFLPECLLLLCPALYAQIDWSRGVEFLNTELFSPVPAGSSGQMHVDVLVRVHFRDGTARVVLLHIEIQAQRTIVLAHLRALKTRGNPDLMMHEKIELLRKLNRRGYNPKQVVDLYRVVDYIMTLSKMRDELVRQIIREQEAESEYPLTSFEELALEEGVERGLRKAFQRMRRVILQILQSRFGEEATRFRPALARIRDLDRLESLTLKAAQAASLEEFEQELRR